MSSIVGIDLGTSNTVVARVGPSNNVEIVPIEQRTTLTTTEARELLPSCLYGPLESEGVGLDWIVGEAARRRGAEIPGRMVASSKSWLCHPRADKHAPILPWGIGGDSDGSDDDVPKLSVVDATTRILGHVRQAWDRRHPEQPLADQRVILTVPASFDAVARELTIEASKRAGLEVRLLEEPQAAFYAAAHKGSLGPLLDWMTANARTKASVLVCDIGGGTTDLSLLEVEHGEAEPLVRRVAVGNHLLLGGDNMDLALAHAVEPELAERGQKLDARQFSELVAACRRAKEVLLGADGPEAYKLTLLGRGSQLLGATRSVKLSRQQAASIVLDGFLPIVRQDEAPTRTRSGLVALGLPYERDVAITRHIAAFIRRHTLEDQRTVDALLLNGGVFRAEAIVARVVESVGTWQAEPPMVLEAHNYDTAVAVGAAIFGLALQGLAPRITGGAAHSYLLGVGKAPSGRPLAVCAIPKGAQEGVVHRATQTPLKLLVGKPARFDVYSSDHITTVEAGTLHEIDPDRYEALPPLTTTVPADASTTIPVVLEAELSPVGTLEIACVEQSEGPRPRRFRLAFDLRSDAQLDPAMSVRGPISRRPAKALDDALGLLSKVYGKGTTSEARDAKNLPRELDRLLGERDEWSADTTRALADRLLEHARGRRRTVDHERVYFQLTGYCMRPGVGAPGDEQRCAALSPMFAERLAFPKEARTWQQFFICFRRVAAGLKEPVQMSMRDELDPFVAPAELKMKKPKGHKPESSDYEILELLGYLEHVPPARRADLGAWILERTWTKRDPRLWTALGRLGARVPAYASVHHVVSARVAEKWLDHLLREKWADLPTAPRAACDMARATGDRSRDVSDALRAEVARRLDKEGADPGLSRAVREVVEVVARERAEFFGERLPPGLSL